MARRSTDTLSDDYVKAVVDILKRDYAPLHKKSKVESYRQNFASIRICVIDPDFQGMNLSERDERVWKILERLPDEIQSQITMLVLLTPKETKTSLAYLEFSDPTPSGL